MNTSILLAALAFLLQVSVSDVKAAPGQPLRRRKRNVLQMCQLIQRHTNRGCLDFNDYGCFCGWGNAGSSTTPVDDIDNCCRQHDICYGTVACWLFYPQFVGYNVQCTEDNDCQCQDSPIMSPCSRSVCECDLEFAQCLGSHSYNGHYREHDWYMCDGE